GRHRPSLHSTRAGLLPGATASSGLDLPGAAPAALVLLANDLRVRHRAHDRANADLLVALDGRLPRAAVLLAPHERDLVADLDIRIDGAERQHRALVVAVACERREADYLAVLLDPIVRRRCIVRQRQIDVLVVLGARLEHRAEDLADVVRVPRERDLLAVRLVGDLLECLTADEVVVELHERAVTDLVRRDVVVLDVGRYEAARKTARALVAVGRQPLAVRLQLVAGIDGGQRRRDPAGLERIRRVRARPDLMQTEILAGLDDRGANLLALLVRAPDLESRCSGHAVTQRAHGPPRDLNRAHVEELDLLDRAAVQLLDHLPRVRALDLVAVALANDGLAHRPGRGTIVLLDLDVVAAGRGVELDPVRRRRASDIDELVLLEMEEDAVADDVTVVRDGNVLLGLVDAEVCEAVDRRLGEQLQRVRAFDVEVHHVMGLIEEHARLTPRALLVAPVRELGGNHRINIGTDLRIPKQINGIPYRLQQIFQASLAHSSW